MDKSIANPEPAPAERRSGMDRRLRDAGPPGRHERRRGVEARQPEVVELEMSASEWADFDDIAKNDFEQTDFAKTVPMPLRAR